MKFTRDLRDSLEDLKSIHVLNHKALMCTSNYLHVPARMQKKDISRDIGKAVEFSLHTFLRSLGLTHVLSLSDNFLEMKIIIITIKNVPLNPYGPFPYCITSSPSPRCNHHPEKFNIHSMQGN